MKKLLPVLLLFLIGCHKAPTILPTEVTTWRTTGLDVSWDQSGNNRIAYSIKEADGYNDIHHTNPNGSNKTQLTYFNEYNNAQSECSALWARLVSFAPDGTRFIGGVQLSLITQEGKIVMVEIK